MQNLSTTISISTIFDCSYYDMFKFYMPRFIYALVFWKKKSKFVRWSISFISDTLPHNVEIIIMYKNHFKGHRFFYSYKEGVKGSHLAEMSFYVKRLLLKNEMKSVTQITILAFI